LQKKRVGKRTGGIGTIPNLRKKRTHEKRLTQTSRKGGVKGENDYVPTLYKRSGTKFVFIARGGGDRPRGGGMVS